MSVFIVRAFVGLRRAISENRKLANKVAQVERRLADHDKQILVLARAIKQLTGPKPVPQRRRIGFHSDEPQPANRPVLDMPRRGIRIPHAGQKPTDITSLRGELQ